MRRPTKSVPPSCVVGLFSIFSLIAALTYTAATIHHITKNGIDLTDQKLKYLAIFAAVSTTLTLIAWIFMRWIHKRTNHEDYIGEKAYKNRRFF